MGQSDPNGASPLRTVGVAILLTVAAVIATGTAGIAAGVLLGALGADLESPVTVIAFLLAAQLGFLAVGYGYVASREIRAPIERVRREHARPIALGVLAALVLGVGLFLALEVVDLAPDSIYFEDEAPASGAVVLAGVAVFVLVAPPVEEYLFRGAIQGRLRRAFGPTGAAVGAGVLFGSIHFFNYSGSPLPAMVAGTVVMSVVGAIFGLAYERTGNLTVPIVVHALYNAALVSVAVLPSAL